MHAVTMNGRHTHRSVRHPPARRGAGCGQGARRARVNSKSYRSGIGDRDARAAHVAQAHKVNPWKRWRDSCLA